MWRNVRTSAPTSAQNQGAYCKFHFLNETPTNEHEGLATARLAQARREDVMQTSNKERKRQSEITFLCICGPAFCQIILAEPHPHNSWGTSQHQHKDKIKNIDHGERKHKKKNQIASS
jgi:hypothetical protein